MFIVYDTTFDTIIGGFSDHKVAMTLAKARRANVYEVKEDVVYRGYEDAIRNILGDKECDEFLQHVTVIDPLIEDERIVKRIK